MKTIASATTAKNACWSDNRLKSKPSNSVEPKVTSSHQISAREFDSSHLHHLNFIHKEADTGLSHRLGTANQNLGTRSVRNYVTHISTSSTGTY